MIEAGRGTVAGISSLAAWRGLPRGGRLLGQQGGPRHAARVHPRGPAGTGVRVVSVFPGFIRIGSANPEPTGASPFSSTWRTG